MSEIKVYSRNHHTPITTIHVTSLTATFLRSRRNAHYLNINKEYPRIIANIHLMEDYFRGLDIVLNFFTNVVRNVRLRDSKVIHGYFKCIRVHLRMVNSVNQTLLRWWKLDSTSECPKNRKTLFPIPAATILIQPHWLFRAVIDEPMMQDDDTILDGLSDQQLIDILDKQLTKEKTSFAIWRQPTEELAKQQGNLTTCRNLYLLNNLMLPLFMTPNRYVIWNSPNELYIS